MLGLIVVIIDISAVPVGTVVTWADGCVFVVVVLAALVIGASVVHPVGQVSLQPLVLATHKPRLVRLHSPSTNLQLTDAADKASAETAARLA